VFLVFSHILREIALFLDICGADVMCHFDMKATPSVMHNVAASCTPTQFLHEYVHRDWGRQPLGDYTTDTGGVLPLVIISATLGEISIW
jgi:hypothetical protein